METVPDLKKARNRRKSAPATSRTVAKIDPSPIQVHQSLERWWRELMEQVDLVESRLGSDGDIFATAFSQEARKRMRGALASVWQKLASEKPQPVIGDLRLPS